MQNEAEPPSYQQIASRLRTAIQRGDLAPGAKLPSVRHLAQIEQVSAPTAEHALRLLEAAGLVVARPRSGFYVAAGKLAEPQPALPRAMARPVTLTASVHQLFARVRSPDLVALGAASPCAEWLPEKALARSLLSASRRLGPSALAYSVPPGRLDLRSQIARRAARWGLHLSPDQLIVTHGQSQAMRLALQVTCQRGDVVAIESPCYFGTLMLMRSLGLRAIAVPTHPRSGMDLAALERILRTHPVSAVVAVPTANNPLGFTMPVAGKRRLVELLDDAGVPLIEDDVYGDLSAGKPRAPACKAFDESGNVLYCTSVSKTMAPGWRIGWIAPGHRFDAVLEARVEASLAGTPLLEAALAEMFASGDYDRHLRRYGQRIKDSVRTISARIAATWPEGTRLRCPDDGFLLWVELPACVDALSLYEAAGSEGISISPGVMFCPEGHSYGHHVRINCAQPTTPKLLAALDRIGTLAAAQAGSRALPAVAAQAQ
ncbi:PLP-dependent aminotransferase family protein [Cupriavidus basilensis]|uniref:PLP-dependent aminotransferase family protein n=1 Tax=Cupriavidus basilensis TaxID=68895 RepID=A0ABT6ATL5_9BURK|nr:PLP-dependent aminotransferase family protein [Cupriavidus basilensis]MDF3835972.1 PLP-dependent aminotransferase family protein [Cupriavidus basilensis]